MRPHLARNVLLLLGLFASGPAAAGDPLAVEPGWRETVIHWRMSVSQGNVGAPPGLWPLPANAGERRRAGASDGLCVKAWLGPNARTPAREAGLRRGELVVAVDDPRLDLAGRAFMTWSGSATRPETRSG